MDVGDNGGCFKFSPHNLGATRTAASARPCEAARLAEVGKRVRGEKTFSRCDHIVFFYEPSRLLGFTSRCEVSWTSGYAL